MGRSKKHKPKTVVPVIPSTPWWKSFKGKITLVPVATLVAAFVAVSGYKNAGADELRSQVYQPLFADLMNVKKFADSLSHEQQPITNNLQGLQESGAFKRTPPSIQRRLLNIVERANGVSVATAKISEIVVREMSVRVGSVKDEKQDRTWRETTSATLRELSLSKKGFADSLMQTMSHEARGPAIDVRDPTHPIVAGPGGPTFVVRDWVEYPGSLSKIDELFTDLDYLYFNPRIDGWYWQLTREDLKRINVSLPDFLKPVHDMILKNDDFKLIASSRPALLKDIADMETLLTGRIRDPKRIKDLIFE